METPQEALLIRYGELGLKGANRPWFERKLAANLRVALADTPDLQVRRLRGRMVLSGARPPAELERAAARVFGVTSLSSATVLPAGAYGADALAEAAVRCARQALPREFPGDGPVRMKVEVRRADKDYPLRSIDVARKLGAALLADQPRYRVDLNEPELTVGVDLRPEAAFVFAGRRPGPGGLPVATTGRVHCLLSGGIDSPVAAWLCMKRGMRVDFISFYSFPYVGPQTRDKVLRLAEELMRWQPEAVLHLVPFAAYQEAIRDHAPEAYRTILYRRAMQRIASVIARMRKGKALVTGESVGQVASQTLENMRLIEEASSLPVLRPLVTYDKLEVVELARRIGTYEVSTLPAPDCCTVFQPASPVVHGRLVEVQAAEAELDLGKLTHDAVHGTERIPLTHQP